MAVGISGMAGLTGYALVARTIEANLAVSLISAFISAMAGMSCYYYLGRRAWQQFQHNAVATVGTVVSRTREEFEHSDGDVSVTFSMDVTFRYGNTLIELNALVSETLNRSFDEGEPIPVHFDPREPEIALLGRE